MAGAELRAGESSSPALALTRIALLNFRSYARAELGAASGLVVLAGANGSGKTNLIEAISLLSPGRGLRGAKLGDLQRKAPSEASGDAFAEGLWAVSATVTREGGTWEIGTGLLPKDSAVQRRTLHLNGAPAGNADVAELLPMLWLTPAQDRLFLDGASERRRFLDRLVFALEPAHARRAGRYERAMQERLRLLRDGSRDAVWLDGLEATMAEEGSAVCASRLATLARLNGELAAMRASAFPSAHLALKDSLGERAADAAAMRDAFAGARARDAEIGRTTIGPHTADLDVRHTAKRADARDCSTGEQKALLISIVLANARAQTQRHDGLAPLLLLDEIAAHLDAQRRAALFEEIFALRAQAWLTGTDKNLFAPLEGRAQFFAISGGQFMAQD